MARITIKDKIHNRFDLVLIAAQRARYIQNNTRNYNNIKKKDKCTVIALREIEQGLV